VGVIEQLSNEQMNALRGYGHPLDKYAESIAYRHEDVTPGRIMVVLALVDSCFHDQDPDNYRHDWKSAKDIGVRMYRYVTKEELHVLLEVVGAAHEVVFSKEDSKIVCHAHASYVEREAGQGDSNLGLVVYHPDNSERLDMDVG
jgi:hypothetical protein